MPTAPTPTILVADDDPEMRAYIRRGLRSAHVVEAADGDEALTLARDATHGRPLDLVIADVRMPGLDGYALCTALHADAGTSHVPVLIVSGEPPRESACAHGFLAKPFNAARLRDAVTRLLPPSR
ncbi:MAG: response regulator [Bacteroidota bacterium]